MAYYKCGSIHPTQNSNVVVDTASGAIANFQTHLALPLLKTRFDFKATQDLNGQSGPYPAGGGVNKFDKDTMLIDGAYINDEDGTQRDYAGDKCTDYIEILPNTAYYIVSEQTQGRWGAWYDENKAFISGINGYGTKTSPATAKYVRLTVVRQDIGNPNTFGINYPSTDTSYHPYSNICPISGVSALSGVHCHKNLYQYDESKVTIGTTSGGTTRSYLPLGLKGACTLTFSASLKSGEEPTAHFINIGKMKDGIITVLQSFIQGANLFERALPFNEGDEVVLVSASESTYAITSSLPRYDIQIEVGSQATIYEPYNGSTILINLGGTYYGGYVSQDKDGKSELVVTHGYASYDLSKIPPNETTDGWDSWLIYRAERAESNPSSSVGKLCNCCPEYSYAGSQINRPHYYVSAGAFVMYLAENTYRDGYLEYTYPLETPFTVALSDGQSIKTLPGINNIFADTGDTTVEFRKIGD